MTNRPLSDEDGEFGHWEWSATARCPRCGQDPCQYRVWESRAGGHEDVQYRCSAGCGYVWWGEGVDP